MFLKPQEKYLLLYHLIAKNNNYKRTFTISLNPAQLHEPETIGVFCCAYYKQIIICWIVSKEYNPLTFLTLRNVIKAKLLYYGDSVLASLFFATK